MKKWCGCGGYGNGSKCEGNDAQSAFTHTHTFTNMLAYDVCIRANAYWSNLVSTQSIVSS